MSLRMPQEQASIQRIIFEELPKDCFPWRKSDSFFADETQIDSWCFSIRDVLFGIYAGHLKRFPTKRLHLKFFLKDFLLFVDEMNAEVPMDIREEFLKIEDSIAACSSMRTTNHHFDYKTFFHPEAPKEVLCVVKNCNLLISSGTTGLSVWPAALALCDFFCFDLQNHFSFYPSHIALEIGAGTGISGLFFASLSKDCIEHVYLSDVNESVLDLLSENISINGLERHASAKRIDWCSSIGNSAADFAKIDFIFASDVIYDPDLFEDLAAFLKCQIATNPCVFILMAACIRNEDTWKRFIKELERQKLSVHMYSLSRSHFSLGFSQYCDSLIIFRIYEAKCI